MDTAAGRQPGTGTPILKLVADWEGRVDAAIVRALPGLTRAHIQRLIDAGFVTVNGETIRKSHQLRLGDELVVVEPAAEPVPEDSGLDLPILYEDDQLVVINKPAGLAVHGAPNDTTPCVASWWHFRLEDPSAFFDVERPGIVHRLDKDTTGVLLLAKTPAAQAALSKAFEQRATSKTYLAVCAGIPSRERAIVDAAIGRSPGDRTKMAVTRKGRESRTEYEVLGAAREMSFLKVKPETGRTHQIRVHLAAIHCPVHHDRVYGHDRSDTSGRQMLHAYQITVPHPSGGTLTVTAPLPADMEDDVRSIAGEAVVLEYQTPRPPLLIRD